MLDALLLSFASLHFDGRGINPNHYHQVNPGVILQDSELDYRLLAGSYRNSFGHRTWMLAASGDGKVTAFGGIATGYRFPVIAGLRCDVGRVTMFAVPKVGPGTVNVIGFTIRVPI